MASSAKRLHRSPGGSSRPIPSPRTAPHGQTGDLGGFRRSMGISQRLFARLLSVSERSVAKAEGGHPLNEDARRRFLELARLHDALSMVVDPADLPDWLQAPNPAFDDLTPLQVIERGEVDRLWRMVFDLESGVPV